MHLMTSWLRFLGPSLLVFGLAACDAPVDDEALTLRNAPTNYSGVWPPGGGGGLNTAWLGNMALMRLLPPGVGSAEDGDGAVHHVDVLDGGVFVPVTEVVVSEGVLILTTAGGTYEGDEVIGSRWWLGSDYTHYITIGDVVEKDAAPGYLLYQRWIDEGPQLWPVCETGIDGEQWAYLVEDLFVDVEDGSISHDAGPLLVACASGALGKAITWGFSPWYARNGDLSLYQTGVRTVRADYCGDGTAHTEEGTPIQVSNALAGLDFCDPNAETEAIFGPDGAICLSEPRIENAEVECKLPSCEEYEPTESYHAWTKLAPMPPSWPPPG